MNKRKLLWLMSLGLTATLAACGTDGTQPEGESEGAGSGD